MWRLLPRASKQSLSSAVVFPSVITPEYKLLKNVGLFFQVVPDLYKAARGARGIHKHASCLKYAKTYDAGMHGFLNLKLYYVVKAFALASNQVLILLVVCRNHMKYQHLAVSHLIIMLVVKLC